MSDIVLTVDSNQAINSLRKLQDQTKKLTDQFSGLRSAIAGLALGTVINNAIQFADRIQDISDASGIAVDNVLALSDAVEESGGSAEKAGNGLLTLSKNIGLAIDGSDQLQKAFREVGISLNDLSTLSQKDLFEKSIRGLSQITDISRRAAISNKLFGDTFKTVDTSMLAARYDSATVNIGKLADATRAASEFQGKLDKAFLRLQESILKVLKPLFDFINQLDDKQIEAFINAVVNLGAALAVFAGIATAVRGLALSLEALGNVLRPVISFFGSLINVIGSLALVFIPLKGIFKTFKITIEILATRSIPAWIKAFKNGTSVASQMGKTVLMLSKRFEYLIGNLTLLVGGLLLFAKKVGMALFPLGKLIAKIYLLIDAIKQLSEGKTLGDVIDSWALSLERFVTDSFPRLANAINWLNDKLNLGLNPETQNEMNNEIKRFENRAKDAMQNVAQSTTVTTVESKKLKDEIEQIRNSYQDVHNELISNLNLKTQMIGKTEDEIEIMQAVYDVNSRIGDQLGELNKKRKEWADGTEEQKNNLHLIDNLINQISNSQAGIVNNVKQQIIELQSARLLEQDRLRTIENISKELDDQQNRYQQLGDILRNATQQQQEITFEGKLQGMSPMQKQIETIKENARKAALEAGKAYAQAFEDNGDGLTPERAEELRRGLDQIANAYNNIANAQIENLQQSQTFSVGWQEAFNNYYDSATNAANQARNAFSSFTNAMESAIDKFVETGKFSFKDFAKSVISDLIKIQLKASAMKLLGAMGFGNPFSGFAGFFAEGGYIPPGKFGVVGEAGPELVSGPADVTPGHELGGQVVNNYITNNINALDAKSVAQLFVQNRKTLFGATETARKEMPVRAR